MTEKPRCERCGSDRARLMTFEDDGRTRTVCRSGDQCHKRRMQRAMQGRPW